MRRSADRPLVCAVRARALSPLECCHMTSFCPLSAHPAHPAHPARRFALIASTVALGACQGATLPDRLPGLAAFYPDAAAAALIVPDTVRAGVPFAVTIQTLTGECRQSGRTDVVHAGQVAALTLYRDMACSESGTRGSSWGAPCRSASIRRVRPLSA